VERGGGPGIGVENGCALPRPGGEKKSLVVSGSRRKVGKIIAAIIQKKAPRASLPCARKRKVEENRHRCVGGMKEGGRGGGEGGNGPPQSDPEKKRKKKTENCRSDVGCGRGGGGGGGKKKNAVDVEVWGKKKKHSVPGGKKKRDGRSLKRSDLERGEKKEGGGNSGKWDGNPREKKKNGPPEKAWKGGKNFLPREEGRGKNAPSEKKNNTAGKRRFGSLPSAPIVHKERGKVESVVKWCSEKNNGLKPPPIPR